MHNAGRRYAYVKFNVDYSINYIVICVYSIRAFFSSLYLF